MELREFVKATLVQIIEGVYDARQAISDMGAAKDGAEAVPSTGTGEYQVVEFDVAVTVVESSELAAGAGAKLAVFSIGGKGSKGTESSAVNHVKFKVPLKLPKTAPPPDRPINYKDRGVV